MLRLVKFFISVVIQAQAAKESSTAQDTKVASSPAASPQQKQKEIAEAEEAEFNT